jgi:hypothetical protein
MYPRFDIGNPGFKDILAHNLDEVLVAMWIDFQAVSPSIWITFTLSTSIIAGV